MKYGFSLSSKQLLEAIMDYAKDRRMLSNDIKDGDKIDAIITSFSNQEVALVVEYKRSGECKSNNPFEGGKYG